jgi:hypothetical protein
MNDSPEVMALKAECAALRLTVISILCGQWWIKDVDGRISLNEAAMRGFFAANSASAEVTDLAAKIQRDAMAAYGAAKSPTSESAEASNA